MGSVYRITRQKRKDLFQKTLAEEFIFSI